MNSDLTVIYLTLNNLSDSWVRYHLDILKKAVSEYPVISISRLPMDFGDNYIQHEPYGYINIYRQILRGAKLAKTPFIAVAEDDTLYCREHFACFRPKPDEAAYNSHRWKLFSWNRQIFSLAHRVTNAGLIASKEFVIEALEERFAKWDETNCEDYLFGEIGRPSIEGPLKLKQRKMTYFYSDPGIVQVSHPLGVCQKSKRKKKVHSQVKAIEIPYWRKASKIAAIFNEKKEQQ